MINSYVQWCIRQKKIITKDQISEWGFYSYLQLAVGPGDDESEDAELCSTSVEAVSVWERGERVLYRHTGRRRDLGAGEELAAGAETHATDATENANVHTYRHTHEDVHILNKVKKSLNKGGSCCLFTYHCKKQNTRFWFVWISL